MTGQQAMRLAQKVKKATGYVCSVTMWGWAFSTGPALVYAVWTDKPDGEGNGSHIVHDCKDEIEMRLEVEKFIEANRKEN